MTMSFPVILNSRNPSSLKVASQYCLTAARKSVSGQSRQLWGLRGLNSEYLLKFTKVCPNLHLSRCILYLCHDIRGGFILFIVRQCQYHRGKLVDSLRCMCCLVHQTDSFQFPGNYSHLHISLFAASPNEGIPLSQTQNAL